MPLEQPEEMAMKWAFECLSRELRAAAGLRFELRVCRNDAEIDVVRAGSQKRMSRSRRHGLTSAGGALSHCAVLARSPFSKMGRDSGASCDTSRSRAAGRAGRSLLPNWQTHCAMCANLS
jgi:hypothetical protein